MKVQNLVCIGRNAYVQSAMHDLECCILFTATNKIEQVAVTVLSRLKCEEGQSLTLRWSDAPPGQCTFPN